MIHAVFFQLRRVLYAHEGTRYNQQKYDKNRVLLLDKPLRRSRKALWAVHTACRSRYAVLRGISLHTAVWGRLNAIFILNSCSASRYALRAPHAIQCRFVPPIYSRDCRNIACQLILEIAERAFAFAWPHNACHLFLFRPFLCITPYSRDIFIFPMP